eukprot:46857-Karenia_brevis.AAC.1
MQNIIQQSQPSWSGSGWPVQEGESFFGRVDGSGGEALHLKHSVSDCEQGIRAYIIDLLASL